MGAILQLCQERRGIQRGIHFLDPTRVMISYEMPLNEVILDFYDKLKSRTQGYASLDYELLGYRESDLVRLDILLNGEAVDALSFITHKERSIQRGRQLAEKMKELIPRQMFEIAIQAAIGNKDHRARDDRSDEEERHWRNATAATLRASASSSKSRRKERSG